MAIWWSEDWRRRGRELWSSEGARAGYSQLCEMTRLSDGIEVTRSGCSSASRACGVPRFAPVSEMLWGCCGEGTCSGYDLGVAAYRDEGGRKAYGVSRGRRCKSLHVSARGRTVHQSLIRRNTDKLAGDRHLLNGDAQTKSAREIQYRR
jgi:hypothetical protein